MVYKIILFIFLISIASCQNSIKTKAKSAAKDYCNCIKNNIFSYDSAVYLYIHCENMLSKKYKLHDLRLRVISGEIDRDSIPVKMKNDIDTFDYYFLKYSDSCQRIPAPWKGRF